MIFEACQSVAAVGESFLDCAILVESGGDLKRSFIWCIAIVFGRTNLFALRIEEPRLFACLLHHLSRSLGTAFAIGKFGDYRAVHILSLGDDVSSFSGYLAGYVLAPGVFTIYRDDPIFRVSDLGLSRFAIATGVLDNAGAVGICSGAIDRFVRTGFYSFDGTIRVLARYG